MKRIHASLLLALAVAAGGCAREDGPPPGPTPHERMVALLDQIEARTNVENRFLAETIGREAEQELSGLEARLGNVRSASP